MLIQGAIQTNRSHSTFDHFILDLATTELIKKAWVLQLFLNTVALANTRRANHNHSTDVTGNGGFGHLIQDVKTLADTRHNFFVSFHWCLGRSRWNRCWDRATCGELYIFNWIDTDANYIWSVFTKVTFCIYCHIASFGSGLITFDQSEGYIVYGLITITTMFYNDCRHFLAPYWIVNMCILYAEMI